MAAGHAPRWITGWTPKTTYHYDENGRLAYTTTESEWDEYNRAVVDAYKDWKSLVHSCGHSLDDTSHTPGTAIAEGAPKFRAAFFLCRACLALHDAQFAQSQRDKDYDPEEIAHHARVWQTVRYDQT